MVVNMKISFLKSKNDTNSFKRAKIFGMDVYEIEDLEKVDDKLEDLVNKQYNTIFITNELAGFSENIIKKYNTKKDITIFITPSNKIS